MESLLKELLPAGPWRFPLLFIAIVIWLFPRARKLWLEFRQREQRLAFLKTRLELANLMLDLRAAAKQDPDARIPSDLLDLQSLVLTPTTIRSPNNAREVSSTRDPRVILTLHRRLFWGMQGSLVTQLAQVVYAWTQGLALSVFLEEGGFAFSFGLGLILVSLTSGAAAAFIEKRSPLRLFIVGASFPLLMSIVFGALF